MRFKGYCIFLTILTDEDREAAKEFMIDNEYNWTYLFADMNSEVISTYQVSSYPTYYFISSGGNLLLSPALSPAENFETYLFNIIEGRNSPQHRSSGNNY